MICSSPIEAAELADYWLALLAKPEEDAVEEHLLGCDPCSARLHEVIELADAVRGLARQGSLRVVVSDEYLKRAAQDGLRIREYNVPSGGSVECTVTADDDLLIGRLAADMRGAKRVDLSLCDANGNEQSRLPDIPFSSAAGSVALQESISDWKAAPDSKMIVRLFAVDDFDREHLLGEYTFNHTRTLPGPGNW